MTAVAFCSWDIRVVTVTQLGYFTRNSFSVLVRVNAGSTWSGKGGGGWGWEWKGGGGGGGGPQTQTPSIGFRLISSTHCHS